MGQLLAAPSSWEGQTRAKAGQLLAIGVISLK